MTEGGGSCLHQRDRLTAEHSGLSTVFLEPISCSHRLHLQVTLICRKETRLRSSTRGPLRVFLTGCVCVWGGFCVGKRLVVSTTKPPCCDGEPDPPTPPPHPPISATAALRLHFISRNDVREAGKEKWPTTLTMLFFCSVRTSATTMNIRQFLVRRGRPRHRRSSAVFTVDDSCTCRLLALI